MQHSLTLKMRALAGAALAASLWAVPVGWAHASAATSAPLQTIATLEVPRYMGTWYEIAKFPNRFQSQCVSGTQASYRMLEDGQLEVINRCRQASGEMAEAVGRARQIGAADSPRLKVRFAPAWLSFLPMVWGDYWVIDLDSAYQLVAVSEPNRDYLWILSRTPAVTEADYTALLHRLREQGLDLSRLERTQQP